MLLFHIGALTLALGLSPWLLARLIDRTKNIGITLAIWGPSMVGLNMALPVCLQCAGIPITANTLTLAHTLTAIGIIILWRITQRLPPRGNPVQEPDFLLPTALLLFTLLVIPFTHIAGIDTYKWQDLAGNVMVENRIAWLVHPLSLLGFTPRSYPSAQPLVLATIEMMGHTGVDWGFYILSVSLGITGLWGAWWLGIKLGLSHRTASWFACLYIFSPVFMRYNYWATGRGMLLALLPLYLLTLLHCFRSARPWAALKAVAAFAAMSLLVATSHKAGLVGVILIPCLILFSPVFHLVKGRFGFSLLLLFMIGIALVLTGFSPNTVVVRAVTRFGWLTPLAVLGLFGTPRRLDNPTGRFLLAAGSGTLALAWTPEMYGALLALPFITSIAVIGWEWIQTRHDNRLPHLASGLFILMIIPAVTIVINQAKDSPSESLYQAARFLEHRDPQGPFRIEAPGKARAQIQAYVSGCPRFTLATDSTSRIEIQPAPTWTGNTTHMARHWISYLRTMLVLTGTDTEWYGQGDKTYVITVDDKPDAPAGTAPLFTHGNVKVFEKP